MSNKVKDIDMKNQTYYFLNYIIDINNFDPDNLIRSITKTSDDYDEEHMKIKFNSDDELPLNKAIEIPSMIIVVRAVLMKIRNINKFF